MTATVDAIVIGAGANGLVASSVLARGGLKTLLLESQGTLGGQGRAVEFAPGFRAAPLATDPGWLPPAVARAAGIDPPSMRASDAPTTLALGDGSCLTLWRDAARAAQEIRRHSAADADRWPTFVTRLKALTRMLETLYTMPAPDVDIPSSDWLPLLGLARDFRGLGRENMIEFLRVLPMSVAELLDDTFASEALKAAIAPGGIRDHRQGPRSNATGFVLLHYLVGATLGAMRRHGSWAGGDDAVTRAAEAAAKRAGVTIRTGAAVARIDVRDDAVAGVTLANGETLAAKRVLSTADPTHTLAEWIDPVWLDPEFLHAVSNIRYRGCTAFVMYAVEGPPDVKGLAPEAQGGVVSLTASLRDLERAADAAKYAMVSERPHVEFSVPSLNTPGLAPEGKHVVVARAQYAPYALRGAAWDDARRSALADAVTKAIESAAPCFGSRVLHRAAWTPADLEARFGLPEGAATQGEMGLDQILFMRPVAGWGRYAMPIRGLYLGGAGTHPGPGVLGGSGALAARRMISDGTRA